MSSIGEAPSRFRWGFPKVHLPVVWSPLLGLARSSLAFGMLGTLLLTPSASLFRPVLGIGEFPLCSGIQNLGLFCVVENLDIGRYFACALLVWVIVGYLPQVSALFHFWVAFSLNTGISIPEGGDQIGAIITFMLIPVCLGDPRLNHWHRGAQGSLLTNTRLSIAWVFICLIKLQMTVVYFYSVAGKHNQPEWTDGTFLYYQSLGIFGPVGIWKHLSDWAFQFPILLALATWTPLLIEFVLACTCLSSAKYRPYILLLGTSFHLAIAIYLGLWSFFFAMFGALILFAVPRTSPAYGDATEVRELARALLPPKWARSTKRQTSVVTHESNPSD